MSATKICCSCRAGENDYEADVYVTGKVPDGCWPYRSVDANLLDRDSHPFRGWLCADHWGMMVEDGAELVVRRSLNDRIKVGAR